MSHSYYSENRNIRGTHDGNEMEKVRKMVTEDAQANKLKMGRGCTKCLK